MFNYEQKASSTNKSSGRVILELFEILLICKNLCAQNQAKYFTCEDSPQINVRSAILSMGIAHHMAQVFLPYFFWKRSFWSYYIALAVAGFGWAEFGVNQYYTINFKISDQAALHPIIGGIDI